MELLVAGIIIFIIMYNVFYKEKPEGGTIETIDMKMSNGNAPANHHYVVHIKCPFCERKLYIANQGDWKCYQCEKVSVYYKNNVYKQEDVHSIFAIFITAILAKFCKLDGVVTRKKLDIVEERLKNYLEMNNQQMIELKKIFNKEVKNPQNYEECISDLYEIAKTKTEIKDEISIFIIETMFQLALSDNNSKIINDINNEDIFKFIKNFNVSIHTYESIKESYTLQKQHIKGIDYYYKILQCSKTATDVEIKQQYRELCKKYHPDMYLSKDLPEEIINLTAEKFREINEAYEIIMEELKGTVH